MATHDPQHHEGGSMSEQPETIEAEAIDPTNEPQATTAGEQDHADLSSLIGEEADAPTDEVTE